MFKFSNSHEFLREFKEGERAALERVYVEYVGEVDAAVRRFLSTGGRAGFGWSRVDAGDLIQEAFIRAFSEKGRASFDGQRDFGPFLGALTRNLLVDWARRRGREVLVDELDGLAVPSPHDSDDWADRDTMVAVNDYLAELPEDLKKLHELRYVRCLSQEDACAALSISRQTLRTREKHLCDGLRRHLKHRELALPRTALVEPDKDG